MSLGIPSYRLHKPSGQAANTDTAVQASLN
jgi:hypothetical protein